MIPVIPNVARHPAHRRLTIGYGREKTWSVYIITNYLNSVLYTRLTNDLERHISEHKTGTIKNSLSIWYKFFKLIWFQEVDSPNTAIELDKRIKV